ncbi:hypothetical protein Tco_0204721 [Tanacetum coccineum]
MPLNQGNDMGDADEQLNVETITKDDWFKKPARPPTPDPEWNKGKSVDNEPAQTWLNDLANAENPPLTFNELMSTPINFSTFAMNCLKIINLTKADLVGLIGTTLKEIVVLTTSEEALTESIRHQQQKTKAAKYDMEGIEDMVPNLWSPIKVAYDKYAALGISHWGPKHQRFYGYVINRKSRHDVYSTMRILSVTRVTVNEWYGYGHLKEIIVRRADQKLYKFMEGDFPRLHLNDIEDMLLLVAQNKLNNLDGDVIVHLAVGLHLSDTKVFTMTMEILPEPTSNKLCGRTSRWRSYHIPAESSMPHAHTISSRIYLRHQSRLEESSINSRYTSASSDKQDLPLRSMLREIVILQVMSKV